MSRLTFWTNYGALLKVYDPRNEPTASEEQQGAAILEANNLLASYEDTKFSPDEISEMYGGVLRLIYDSKPFEGDKILCHIGQLKHLIAVRNARVIAEEKAEHAGKENAL